MLNRKIAIITIIFSALIVGLGVSFAFGNTVNSNCPDEIKQAIQNWDKGLDERDARNQNVGQGFNPAKTNANLKVCPTNSTLRTLFLSSLITLTFNTPVHSQILDSKAIQKLFTVAKHYIRLPSTLYPLPSLIAVFTALKRYFEKVFLILLSRAKALPYILLFLSIFLPFYLSTQLYYRFHNLRL